VTLTDLCGIVLIAGSTVERRLAELDDLASENSTHPVLGVVCRLAIIGVLLLVLTGRRPGWRRACIDALVLEMVRRVPTLQSSGFAFTRVFSNVS